MESIPTAQTRVPCNESRLMVWCRANARAPTSDTLPQPLKFKHRSPRHASASATGSGASGSVGSGCRAGLLEHDETELARFLRREATPAAREAAAAEAEASAPQHPAALPLSQRDLAVLATIARGSGSAHECKEG